jgi:hypothetical protein
MQKTKWKDDVIGADDNGVFSAGKKVDQNQSKPKPRAGLPVCAPCSERMPRIKARV